MSGDAQNVIVVPVSSTGRALVQRRPRDADGVGLGPDVALAVDLDVEPRRQRVDDRDADAVQAAGDLVAAAAELAAGVQHGQHDLDRGLALALDVAHRDAAAVVGDPDAAVGEQGDLDPVAVPGQRLVDRVVDHLGDQVVQAALTGRADVHARALADRLEALEHLDVAGVVGEVRGAGEVRDGCDGGLGRLGRLGHGSPFVAHRPPGRRSQRAADGCRGDARGGCVHPTCPADQNRLPGAPGDGFPARTRVGMAPPTRTGVRWRPGGGVRRSVTGR